ncbi:MAG: esterase/lipase family protein [Hydrogenophaga sp.]
MDSKPPSSFIDHRRRTSSLARLQQALVSSGVALAAVWLWWLWPASAAAMFAGLALLTLGYAVILGIETVAAATINRSDGAPRASSAEWLGAWWQEVKVAPQVFAWRQPFRWRQWPDTTEALPTSPPAVVLVHGFFCNRGFWLPWMQRLQALGVPYVSVNLEPIFGSIDDYVTIVDDAVTRATALTGHAPTLICHSMGGLAARAWLAATPGAASRVDKIITIGTPHRGTWLARFSHLANGRQMRHDCDWQQSLVARELQRHPQRNAGLFVCWYSNTDNIVFPASTATLPGADNRLVAGAAHVALAFHPKVMAESLAMVASAGKSPRARTAS